MLRLLAIAALLITTPIFCQQPQDKTIALTVNAGVNPPSVLLKWPVNGPANTVLRRRVKDQPGNSWTELLNIPETSQDGYFDTGVSASQTYEYEIVRANNVTTAYGAAYANFLTPVIDSRGKLLVFIDSTTADALGADLLLYKNDLRGEGWQTVPFKTGPSTTVQWVKQRITDAWNADPNGVKAVLLIGAVPIPYSGSTAWDDRPDHTGAWPCDAYYGDVNGVWTDNTVNIPSTGRPANRNVPGDGKFDQDVIPSAVELPVGRLDFRRLSAGTFGLPPIELLRRYLLKNHRYRNGLITTPRKAIVDDEIGWAGGDAFAADGYRNAYPLTGAEQVATGNWVSAGQRYLLGYGAANSADFSNANNVLTLQQTVNDSIFVAFAGLYGDYFGDWDFETNPLLPAALASKGSLLAAGWMGRPRWQLQGLASGESIGFCLKETQNAQFNTAYGNSDGESGAHTALLGDPTLRALVVAPPTNLSVKSNCTRMELKWTASRDSDVLGYLVYRSFDLNGPYTRITPDMITGTSWADQNAVADTLFYAVRAVKLEQTPGGGAFYNSSTSEIQYAVFVPGTAPTVLGLGGTLTCIKLTHTLGANFQPFNATYQWYDPQGQAIPGTTATTGGIYTVVVTAPNGCTSMAFATVYVDTALPSVTLPSMVTVDCTHPAQSFTVPGAVANVQYTLNEQPVQPGTIIPLNESLSFRIYSASNGCEHLYSCLVETDTLSPGAIATSDGNSLDCNHAQVQLYGNSNHPAVNYSWQLNGQLVPGQNPLVNQPGIYCLTTTAANGCTASDCIEVQASGSAVLGAIGLEGPVCMPTGLMATANGGITPYEYEWSNGNTGEQITLQPNFSGTLTVTITDANQCTAIASTTLYTPLNVIALIQNPSLSGAADGSIELLLYGGLPPYQFLWNTGTTTGTLSGLPNGEYTVTVSDSRNCTTTLSVPIFTLSSSNGIMDADTWNISPNPAHSTIRVMAGTEQPTPTLICIFDWSGRQVIPSMLIEKETSIAVAHLPAGLYKLCGYKGNNKAFEKVFLKF